MKQTKVIPVISVICACVAASSVNAATIPAGTTLTVSTVSQFTSKTAVGRTFEAKLAQDVSVNGKVAIESWKQSVRKDRDVSLQSAQERSAHGGTDVCFGERPQCRGEDECVPAGHPPVTARQAQYGHTAGTLVINPGTVMQFQLLQPVTL